MRFACTFVGSTSADAAFNANADLPSPLAPANIQPWCVSRQLWWGHQIPAWFDADGKCYVAETEDAAQALAGTDVKLTRDPDVLDTWFSSALWPFGTLGWPDQTTELDRHYPNDVLVSGFDILFFWDARMAMQGIHFMKEVPWKTLYLHGLVRAADGSKMSKSKGNTVDPLGLIDQYGADALRFFMAAMESQGRDIKMDESRVAGYRNFATKLWNAARFAQSNGISGSHSIHAPKAELAVNRWIIGEVVGTVEKLNKAFAEFRFDGKPRRLSLTEQGFDVTKRPEALAEQAAAYAYAWEKVARLDGAVDAFLYHRQVDHAMEGGLRFGLWSNKPGTIFEPDQKRPIWHLLKAADTPGWKAAAEPHLKTCGLKSWDELNSK